MRESLFCLGRTLSIAVLLVFMAFAQVPDSRYQRMTRGVNLSSWFEYAGDAQITTSDVQLLVDAGFRHVRLCVAPQWIIPRYTSATAVQQVLSNLDAGIDMLLAGGLAVMLDFHADQPYRNDLNAMNNDGAELINTWSILAQRYSNRDPEELYFEIMNEPDNQFAPAAWWSIQGRAIQAIRQFAPNHTILVAPVYGDGVEYIENVVPYADKNVVYVFHDYEPLSFTHQGASWINDPGVQTMAGLSYPAWMPENQKLLSSLGPPAQSNASAYISEGWSVDLMRQQIGRIGAWARRNNVRVVANEFGAGNEFSVYSNLKVPASSRYRWLRDMRTALEELGIGWSMWDYAHGFDLVITTGGTRTPDPAVLAALGLSPWSQTEPPIALTTASLTAPENDINGDGTHQVLTGEPPNPAVGADVVAAVDLNGDGITDIVTAFLGPSGNPATPISLLISNGDGSFSNGMALFNGAAPQLNWVTDIVVGHFDKSGRPGIFLAEQGAGSQGGQNRLILPFGSVQYEDATAKLPQENVITWGAAAGDIDGDGVDDLIQFSDYPARAQLMTNDGTGAFQVSNQLLPSGIVDPEMTFSAGTFVPRFGTNTLDLVVLGRGSTPSYILLNDGSGHFTVGSMLPPPSTFAGNANPVNAVASDIDDDGQVDLVIGWTQLNPFGGNYIQILINNGDGTFRDETQERVQQLGTTAAIGHIFLADLDSPGRKDLLIEVIGNSPIVRRNLGSGFFVDGQSIRTWNWAVAPTDVTGTGVMSIFESAHPGEYYVHFGQRWFDASTVRVPSATGSFSTFFAPSSSGVPVYVGAPWVSDLSLAGAGQVTFTVAANPSPYSRSTVIRAGSQMLRVVQSGTNSPNLSTFSSQVPAVGGTGNIVVSGLTSATWLVSSDSAWLIPAVDILSGNGILNFTAQPNFSSYPRLGTIMIGDQYVTVTQGASPTVAPSGSCSYTLSLGGEGFPAHGGSGTVNVTTGPNCPWTVSSLPPWLSLPNGASSIGSGSFTFEVLPTAGGDLSGSFTIGGQTFTIQEEAASIPGLASVGSLAQVASEGSWGFTLDAINLGTSGAEARFNFSDNNGNPLALPLTFPQQASMAAPLLASTLDRTLNPNAQVILDSTGPASDAALVGWGQLLTNGGITGFGTFSNPTYGWNAVVPLEKRNASSYVLAFDNTGSLATGLAIANVAAQNANVPVIIRDDTGAQIGTATLALAAQGHTSFMLNQQYPATAGKRGSVEFDTPPGGQISVLGLRANGPALTTLPVLANVGTGGGTLAHATYNGGFTSTFYLVSTGTAAAQFTLSFFDESGNPLSVPLSLPQTGATTTTSALTQTLAAGAMLVVETQAQDALPSVAGSAQLTTTGNISGFEIFRWTTFGQEASVPLETRTPNSFVLVFDDTNGLTTGVAVANGAHVPANITVNLRDDTGALLDTGTINLAARGHASFMLPTAYPGAANLRGMTEFVVPTGGQISVIGLRAKSDGTLTTIPVLTK